MATAFTSGGDPLSYRSHLEPGERSLLSSVFADTIALLDSERAEGSDDELARMVGLGGGDAPPEDPALARLLPEASEDPEQASEFRQLTESGLRDAKIARLQTALLTLRRSDPLELAEPEAAAWLAALTDVRLVLAVRMGIEDESDVEAMAARAHDDDDREGMVYAVYEFLSWLQETLGEAMLDELPDDEEA